MAALVVVLGAAAAATDVLMIAVDDLRPQLACTDVPGTVRPTMHTPHICGFANDSLVLLRSQVAMATCSPSRTALLTGRHATTTHVWDLFTYFRNATGNFTTLPQFFKERGYSTHGMGKIYHPGGASGGGSCEMCTGPDDGTWSWSEPYFHGVDEYDKSPHNSWIRRWRDRPVHRVGALSGTDERVGAEVGDLVRHRALQPHVRPLRESQPLRVGARHGARQDAGGAAARRLGGSGRSALTHRK